MKITKAVVRRMSLSFKVGFRTSFGLSTTKDFSIVELHDSDGNVGYGACSAFMRPWYNEETTMGALFVIKEYLIPSLFEAGDFKDPEWFFDHTSWIRRNRMARASVDCALWELYSKELGIPEYLVYRQPFPGPGLGIRIIGEVTADKVRIVQDADYIYREELAKAGCDKGLGQYFAALTNMRSVGVMGDFRTYDYAVALRAVNTTDFMTADCAEIPFEVLQKVMNRIINEVKGVNRVLYDLTSKPPGTIEFE